MKKPIATVLLIIITAIAFFAAGWTVAALWSLVLWAGSFVFVAALPAPLVFVWREFRVRYGFKKVVFAVCVILPSVVLSALFGFAMILFYGWAGIAIDAFCAPVMLALLISAGIWIAAGCRENPPDKSVALVMLAMCGMVIMLGLGGVINNRIFPILWDNSAFTETGRYLISKLAPAAIISLPLGFGAARLMRLYRGEYSVKAPHFMLLAFAPNFAISGFGALNANPNEITRVLLMNSFVMTATIALDTAIIYGVFALIRSKRKTQP